MELKDLAPWIAIAFTLALSILVPLFTQIANNFVAFSSSSNEGYDGAILILQSFGSFPPGYVAPAPVRTTPAALAVLTISFAHPSIESNEIK